MLQIGITGGIGSGKSTVATVFHCLGIPVYDADSHAKALMTTDGNLKEAIRKEFGTLSFTDQGQLNRNFLASEVFPNQEKLKRLNQLVHPRVAEDYQKWFNVQQNRRYPYVVKEAALLYDSGSNRLLDKVIVVAAPDSVRMERVKERDKRSDLDIETIMKRQMPQEEMIQRADFVVENDGKSMILPQILKLHQLFLTFKK
ncbi:MAG: hypothetical protein RL161_4 [Bacteroidota bacterium]